MVRRRLAISCTQIVSAVILTTVLCPFAVAAMHDLDPVFMQWSRSSQAAELLEDLGYKKPTPVQSMYIFKVRTSQPPVHCQHCQSCMMCSSMCSVEGSSCMLAYTPLMLRLS